MLWSESKSNGQSEENLESLDQVFDDFESKSNIIGLYNLLLKIDRRVNPQLYERDRPYD